MKRKAFTLVELLVVIAIIGLLSTVAIVSLGTARAKSRNAKRVADVKQLVTAFSMGLDANGTYPAGTACVSSVCLGSLSWLPHDAAVDAFINPFITAPTDPADGTRVQGGYVYIESWADGGAACPPGTYLQYTLEALGTCSVGTSCFTNGQEVTCGVKLN
jgi:prepilin-type N-terminal cleavage/methylation domain-containing protein